MKKKYLKFTSLFIVLLFIFSLLLSGCSSNTKQSNSSSNNEAYNSIAKELPTIKYLTDDSTLSKEEAQVFQQMWKKALGINIEIDSVPIKTLMDRTSKLDYQVALTGWGPDYNDPMTFMDLFSSWSANNTTGWKNDQYDSYIKDAQNTNDKAKRMDDFIKAEKLLINQMVIAPLYYGYVSYVTQPGVEGLVRRFVGGTYDFYWTKTKTGTITYNNTVEPTELDPQLATGMRIINDTFEGLMRYDQNAKIIPGIAENYTVSNDGLVYTFHLRDAKWSNGEPVTAQDFKYGWLRGLDPKTASSYAYILYPIKNAEAYNTKKITDPNAVGIKVIDSKTLQVTLEKPTPYFPELTSFATYMPLNQKFYEKVGSKYATEADKMLYDGPFVISEWKHQQDIILTKNDNYWNKDAIKLNQAKILMINDSNTAINLFKTKQLDVVDITGNDIEQFKKDGYEIKNFSSGFTSFIQFNTKDKILSNVNIRKALSLSLNRKVFIEDILKNNANKAATGFVSDIIWGNNDTFRNEAGPLIKDNDVASARQYLVKGIKELGLVK